MEAATVHMLQCPTWIGFKMFDGKPIGSLRFSQRPKDLKKFRVLASAHLQPEKTSKSLSLGVSCSDTNFSASLLETGGFRAPLDEGLILKNKSQEIKPYLDGRSIYLVGMMGSGKTTIGKLISRELGYTFFDSDVLIEQAVDGISVAEIFKLYGETFFREKETEALKKLSLMHQVVVSTGGGAVTRPINWKYMHKGISVWLDVPLEALAQRISEVGTGSRPLLHHESGDAYTAAFKRLSTIWEERGEAYTNANARVSLEHITAKLGLGDVSDLTPTAIAIEAFEQIMIFLRGEDSMEA